MKKRPLALRLLAGAFVLSPLGVLVELMHLYRIPLFYWRKVFIPEIWTWQIIAFVVVTPLVGLCVWTVRPWAYITLLVFSGLILVNNLAVWISGLGMTSLIERVALMAGYLLLVLVVVRKDFYAPYFNPRLRWWEQAQRFEIDSIRIIVRDFGTNEELFEAKTFDVSYTGLFVASDRPVRIGDVFKLDIVFPGDNMTSATGEVVWINGGDEHTPQGFGCRFTALNRYFKAELRVAISILSADMKRR